MIIPWAPSTEDEITSKYNPHKEKQCRDTSTETVPPVATLFFSIAVVICSLFVLIVVTDTDFRQQV